MGRAPLPHRRFDREAVEFAVQVLNEALDADRAAISALLDVWVPVADALRDHPSIQVHDPGSGASDLGAVGLINGLFGVDREDWGHISALMETDEVTGEVLVRRFEVRAPFHAAAERDVK